MTGHWRKVEFVWEGDTAPVYPGPDGQSEALSVNTGTTSPGLVGFSGKKTEKGTPVKQVEVDFGASLGLRTATFTITDADVLATSRIVAALAREAPTGKSLDETEMDGFDIRATPAAGSLVLYVESLFGSVAGKFKFNYVVG